MGEAATAAGERDHAGGSRRTRPVRPRTENVHRLSRRHLAVLALEAPPFDVERPKTRADCAAVERPCPFVGCRHNLYLETSPSGIKFRFPDLQPDAMPVDWSCVLDVADRGGVSLQETGDALNMVRERVRQLQRSALAKVLAAVSDRPRPTERKDPVMPPEPPTKPAPEGRPVDRELLCELTEPELLERGSRLAAIHDEAVMLRAKKKEATADIGKQIASKETAISKLVRVLRTRSEMRRVGCIEVLDFRAGLVTVTRIDTGKEIESRAITKAERQTNIYGIADGKPKRVDPETGEVRDEP